LKIRAGFKTLIIHINIDTKLSFNKCTWMFSKQFRRFTKERKKKIRVFFISFIARGILHRSWNLQCRV